MRQAGRSTEICALSLDEMSRRGSNRKNPYLFRDTLVKVLKFDNLPYEELVGHA